MQPSSCCACATVSKLRLPKCSTCEERVGHARGRAGGQAVFARRRHTEESACLMAACSGGETPKTSRAAQVAAHCEQSSMPGTTIEAECAMYLARANSRRVIYGVCRASDTCHSGTPPRRMTKSNLAE